MVIGFQYRGKLGTLKESKEEPLTTSGINGISDSYKIFKSPANTVSILIYFTEIGFTHFATHLAHEVFNLSVSLNDILEKQSVNAVEEKLSMIKGDLQRIKIVEHFLLTQFKDI